MAQLIYSVIGLSMAILFSTSLTRSVHSSGQRIAANEVLTQMLGVGQDILEDVGRRALPFDHNTDESLKPTPIEYPLVHSAAELTPDSSFGGCTNFAICADLDDFDGISFTRTSNDIAYDVAVEVRYVTEAEPDKAATGQSFSKEVNVIVSSQSIVVGGAPLSVSYARVFSFDKSTDYTPAP